MLTRLKIESIQPPPRTIRLFDGRGLYIEFSPSGGRWWRFKYRFAGKERRISLGIYPDVGIKEARAKREAARQQIAAGIDPGQQRKAECQTLIEQTQNTFEAIAREWFVMVSPTWVKSHSSKIIRRLEREVFPWIGSKPIKEVKALELLSVLRRSRLAVSSRRPIGLCSIADARFDMRLPLDALNGIRLEISLAHWPQR